MKRPFVTKQQLDAIVNKYPTPFYLYDEKGIRENARKLYKAFEWNNGFREYFAVKATPNPSLLKILNEEGCGADCSSLTELMIADSINLTGDDIMFSSNATPVEDYVLARDLGAIINFDDITHIEYYEKNVGPIPETVCCRYNPGGYFELGNTIMDTPSDAKYGMTHGQIIEAFKLLKERGAKTFGIHSFLASNTTSNDYFPTLAAILFRLAVEIMNVVGIDISFVNLSGGIGVPYRPEQAESDIDIISAGVKKAYDDIIIPAGMEVAIYTELGRYMLAPYGCLVASVIHQKHIYKEYIGLDACACNLMRPAMYGAYHHITVSGKEDQLCDHTYDVTGGLCENNDKFAIDRELPRVDIGDLLVIHDTGAHGHSMGYNYNGKLRSAEILLLENGSTRMIRRAESPDDYFATLRFMPE